MSTFRAWLSLLWAVLLYVYAETVDAYIGSTLRWFLIVSSVGSSLMWAGRAAALDLPDTDGGDELGHETTTDDDAGEGDDASAEEPKPES